MVSILLVPNLQLIYKYNTIPCIAPGQHRNPCPVLEWLQEVVSVGLAEFACLLYVPYFLQTPLLAATLRLDRDFYVDLEQ